MKKKLSKSEVFSILDDVEATFAAGLKKNAISRMAKSEDEVKEEESEEEKEKKAKAKKEAEEKEEKKEDEVEVMEKSEDFEVECKNLYKSMSKSELAIHLSALTSVVKPSKEESLNKSEISLKEENAVLRKSMSEMTDKLTKFFGVAEAKSAPMAKAVTEIGYMAKSEATKADEFVWDSRAITKKLEQISKSESTNSSDREAINSYYLEGRNVETIKHLLK